MLLAALTNSNHIEDLCSWILESLLPSCNSNFIGECRDKKREIPDISYLDSGMTGELKVLERYRLLADAPSYRALEKRLNIEV
ncbi:hypothetical protein VCHA53P481_20140 [Vibrio chagasii]|nr:hypothetical protein VCHA36O163_70039 [Vibrio chagasii]CAH7075265.1 hypothetical protein VCHA31O71_80039 [Vibrio chagasii]CAH7109575.1 hypothetical protein VCHA54O482_100039 [Vibrio chagasii]CAH7181807.1 hypothetical protein VCHA43P284_20140 [Vibrio chagasii]CAH7198091.1 hypothetical protein VCHA56P515_20298 [Vibrio chagasii]